MCRFLVFDRKLEFQVKSQILGKNGSLWGGQNLAKTCTQKFENGHICIYIKYNNIFSKIVTNILMGVKISCQVGGRGQKFQIYCR